MKIINLDVPESTILETRDDLFTELVVTGNVYINNHKVTVYEMLEEMDDEKKLEVQLIMKLQTYSAMQYSLRSVVTLKM